LSSIYVDAEKVKPKNSMVFRQLDFICVNHKALLYRLSKHILKNLLCIA